MALRSQNRHQGWPAKIRALGPERPLFSAVVSGREELERIVARLTPGVTVEEFEVSETFAEQHLRSNNTNIRMSAETPTSQGFPGAENLN